MHLARAFGHLQTALLQIMRQFILAKLKNLILCQLCKGKMHHLDKLILHALRHGFI